jgi:Transglycosylase SLT domain
MTCQRLRKRPGTITCAVALAVLFTTVGGVRAAPTAPMSAASVDSSVVNAVAEASGRFNIPPSWIRAVMKAESSNNVRALSPKGAMGLMQIMPETWATLRWRYHLGGDPYDVRDNILGGTALLRELYDRFGAGGFLAAYNAGTPRYLAFLLQGQPLKAETQLYLAKLAALLPELQIGSTTLAPGALPNWRAASIFVSARPVSAGQSWPASRAASRSNAPPPTAPTSSPNAPPASLVPASAGLFAVLDGPGSP